MTKFNLLLIVLLTFALTLFGNDVLNENGDPWNGYSFGSWVIVSDTKVKNDQKEIKRVKQIKVKDKDKFAVNEYSEKEGIFPEEMETKIYHIKGFEPSTSDKFSKIESVKEVVKIENKDYECQVETYNLVNSEKDENAVIKFWKCDTVNIPYRELQTDGPDIALGKDILKAYCKKTSKAGVEETTIKISKFEVEMQINNKKVICKLEELEGNIVKNKPDGSEGQKISGNSKRWLTHEIPGHIAKEESIAEVVQNGKVLKYQRLLVIEDFEVIKNTK